MRISHTLRGLVVLCATASVASTQSLPVNGGCVTISLAATTPSETVPEATQERMARQTPVDELLRPISENEVRMLIRALEPVPLETGGGRAIRAMVQGTDLALDRMQVLLEDVTGLLAYEHAREMLAGLDDIGGWSPASREQARAWFEAIEACAPPHFADRGGQPIFDASLEIIRVHRAELENVLFEASQLRTFSALDRRSPR